jgi:hypothetical protein
MEKLKAGVANYLYSGPVEGHFGSEKFTRKFLTCKNYIYKTVILPVVLYGCESWSLTLREEHRLRVFENRVLRRIFGPKRVEDGS